MRYSIITNPVSGTMTAEQKCAALAQAAEILDTQIHGLDTTTAEEFGQCARELASRCDVLVTAGGDGTFSDIINAIDTIQTPVGFLPLGTGNALGHALQYKGDLAEIAVRIKNSEIRQYDLINCDQKRRAFTSSVGIEGTIIRLRQHYLARGGTGFKTYFRAVLRSYFKNYQRASATITLDGDTFEVANLLTLMVVKQPYYGFGMKVVPRARFDDRQLHILCVSSGLIKTVIGGTAAFIIGNRTGEYRTGGELSVNLDRPLVLQTDGDEGWAADSFSFTILPKALKIKC
ncbi:MAG: diacylglycerol kinase family protein [Syntrophobacterales bacterium]|jgi:diacylglycerol kinase family enzyme